MRTIVLLGLLALLACGQATAQRVNIGTEVFYNTEVAEYPQDTTMSLWHVILLHPSKFDVGFDLNNRITTQERLEQHTDWIVATNLGMFHIEPGASFSLTTSYLKHNNNVLTNHWAKGHLGILAYNQDTVALLRKQDYLNNPNQWTSAISLIRLVSNGQVVWSKQAKFWSAVVIGQLTDGTLLLIHSRDGYSMNKLAHLALERYPDLVNLYYLEGGPEASLSIRNWGDYAGSYETSYNENHANQKQWDIPNALYFFIKPTNVH